MTSLEVFACKLYAVSLVNLQDIRISISKLATNCRNTSNSDLHPHYFYIQGLFETNTRMNCLPCSSKCIVTFDVTSNVRAGEIDDNRRNIQKNLKKRKS